MIFLLLFLFNATITTLKMSSVGSLLGREPGAKEDDVGMKYCGSLIVLIFKVMTMVIVIIVTVMVTTMLVIMVMMMLTTCQHPPPPPSPFFFPLLLLLLLLRLLAGPHLAECNSF